DSDAGWVRPASAAAPQVEIVRTATAVQAVFHIIARPAELTAPRTIVFALEATPVRPKPSWSRSLNILPMNWMSRGPVYSWLGSTLWCLGWTDSYNGWPYAYGYIHPVDDNTKSILSRNAQLFHQAGAK